jgi:general stress protein YciG
MAIRVSDDKEHLGKWRECYRTAAMLARSKEATYRRADGTQSEEGQAWTEIASYFERQAKGSRGFGSMSPLRQRQLASSGGMTAHQNHRAHSFTSEEAQRAGKLGGISVSRDRQHMAQIGRRGGHARAANLTTKPSPIADEDNHAE